MLKYLFFAVFCLFPFAANAQIAGTGHDFSGTGWTTNGEICLPCHTPHNGDLTVTDAPLWNHDVTAVTGYSVYDSGTMDATDVSDPGGVSKLCLSCHDGTVALDAFGGTSGTTTYITGDALFGTDLSNDHPISFTYDDALASTAEDGELHPPTSTASGLGGFISADMLFGTSNDQLECASCHDVHNGPGVTYLLLKSNTGSDLCLTCHDK